MKRTIALTAVSALLVLGACSKASDEQDASATDAVTGSGVTASQDRAPAVPAEASAPGEAEPASQPPSRLAAEGSTIPAAIQGRWGLVPKDCTSQLGDAKGLLTVSARQLKFYEAIARLEKAQEVGDSRIRGTFDFSGEGQSWKLDVVLDVQDGGRTLIRRDYGKDALPGPLKYTRCT